MHPGNTEHSMMSVAASEALVLGTAQLGSLYGIANKAGPPDQERATAIVKEAWDHGIREFDTAQLYDRSEELLGRALADLGLSEQAQIITKFYWDQSSHDACDVNMILDLSLSRLGVSCLYGMMFHNEQMLSLLDEGLSDDMQEATAEGRVKYLGVSVHSPEMAIKALNTKGIDFVQLPANILDRRFQRAGAFRLADEIGKKIYIRSVFLQGLILMDHQDIPERMSFALPVLEKLEALRSEYGMSMQELAFGYIRAEYPNAKVLFGADTPEQVRENYEKWDIPLPASCLKYTHNMFDDIDEKILNPALWPS